jgi:hypothetical protein
VTNEFAFPVGVTFVALGLRYGDKFWVVKYDGLTGLVPASKVMDKEVSDSAVCI